jgi:hypothetical protein
MGMTTDQWREWKRSQDNYDAQAEDCLDDYCS